MNHWFVQLLPNSNLKSFCKCVGYLRSEFWTEGLFLLPPYAPDHALLQYPSVHFLGSEILVFIKISLICEINCDYSLIMISSNKLVVEKELSLPYSLEMGNLAVRF